MASTTISPAVRAKQWDNGFFKEYVRGSLYKRYMGSAETDIFQVKNDLTKKKGDTITINLLGALNDQDNDGSTPLVGNEEALPNEGHPIAIKISRAATDVTVLEEQASPFDIRDAGRSALKVKAARILRNAITTALGSINGTAYSTASAAQKNAWTVANSDRVLFGRLASNYNATHATALNAITAAETLDRATVSKLKAIARSARAANGEGITPHIYGEDHETYVLFVGTRAFRDLKNDMASVLAEAEKRGKENPLFTGGNSLWWDDVIIREVPSIGNFNNTAATPIPLEPMYFCGAQAVGIAWAMTTKSTIKKEDDYQLHYGVGYMELRGVEKLQWKKGDAAAKDWAVVTGFVSAPAAA
jgi:N4-gp56 family major capsid protein